MISLNHVLSKVDGVGLVVVHWAGISEQPVAEGPGVEVGYDRSRLVTLLRAEAISNNAL